MLRLYRNQVEALDIEIRTALKVVGDNHRDLRLLRERRDAAYEKEIGRREELISQVRGEINTLRQDFAQTQSVLSRVLDQLEEAEAKQRDFNRNVQQANQLVDASELTRKQWERSLDQVQEAEAAAKNVSARPA